MSINMWKNRFKFLFNLISTIGLILAISELVLKFLHSSLCNSVGCILAESSLIIPDKILILLGIITFFVLIILSFLDKENLIDAILTVVFSLEGLLVGYQVFRLDNICYFCISIFAIFVLLSFTRILQRRWLVLTGFASFVSVFLLFSVLKPMTKSILPKSDTILIYKASCPHCEKVERFIKARGLKIKEVNVSKCIDFLRTINITTIPALIIRNKNKIEILIGDNNIIGYLLKFETKKRTLNLFDKPAQLFNENNGFCTINSKHCR